MKDNFAFYWIRMRHWKHGIKEKQFYLNQNPEKEMMDYIIEQLNNDWVVDCMKIVNKGVS